VRRIVPTRAVKKRDESMHVLELLIFVGSSEEKEFEQHTRVLKSLAKALNLEYCDEEFN
jgi:hypothetical protein